MELTNNFLQASMKPGAVATKVLLLLHEPFFLNINVQILGNRRRAGRRG